MSSSGGTEVLREYLLALGFKVDETAASKFDKRLGGWSGKAFGLGKQLLGVAAAAQAMVAIFSSQMEKLYYASRRAESTASNLAALSFGAKQVGVEGETMTAAIEGMARALRLNPGLKGLLDSLGIASEGRDKADVMIDFLEKLKSFPHYIAAQYAQMFGMDETTLFMLTAGLDKLKEAAALRKQMAADAGVDLDKAAEAGKRYAQIMREVWERIGLLKDRMMIDLLPTFESLIQFLNTAITYWTKLTASAQNFGELMGKLAADFRQLDFGKLFNGLTGFLTDALPLSKEDKVVVDALKGAWHWVADPLKKMVEQYKGQKAPAPALPPASAPAQLGAPSGAAQMPMGNPRPSWGGVTRPGEMMAALEQKYGLPAGLLDRMWARESNRGDSKYMKSSAGAEGHFQFMPKTAKEFGLENPYDLATSAKAAAEMMAGLMAKYKGNLGAALAAYNWGQGNVDKYLAGRGTIPQETLGYMQSIGGAGTTIQQETNITVNAAENPAAIARTIASEQRGVNSDLVRNLGVSYK